jgi:glycosyltransferase involved in cell wall biosynthesis
LLESDGPEAIADRIETALNEESLPTMSATAREFVVENYSFEVVVKEYKRVFEAVR